MERQAPRAQVGLKIIHVASTWLECFALYGLSARAFGARASALKFPRVFVTQTS